MKKPSGPAEDTQRHHMSRRAEADTSCHWSRLDA
jgi:hypothetical protein